MTVLPWSKQSRHWRLCGLLGVVLASAAHADERAAPQSTGPIASLAQLSSVAGDAPTAPAWRIPAVQDWTDRHGLRTLFVQANELPMVDIRLTFDAGSARDAAIGPGLSGLASLTASMLDEGTSTQTTDQIAAQFEALGAQYSAHAYRDMFTVELRVLSDAAVLQPAVEQLLALLADAQFPDDSLARLRASTAIGQQQREESPAAMANIRFWRELYGQHPYAEPSTGTQASLLRITRSDLMAFKKRFLVRGNASLAITGQLTPAQARALAAQIATRLPEGPAAPALPTPAPLTHARTVRVPFASTQSQVVMGHIGINRKTPDLPALLVGNEMLGGGDFNALLMRELRKKNGLTYGAYSSFVPMRVNGPFSVSFSTRSDQTDAAIALAQQTIAQLLQQGVDEQQVAEVRAGMVNSYPASLSSNENINAMLGMMGFYGLPASYLADYPRQLQQVTAAQVRQALLRHVQPDRLLTVVVGPTTARTPAATPNLDRVGTAAPAAAPDQAPTP